MHEDTISNDSKKVGSACSISISSNVPAITQSETTHRSISNKSGCNGNETNVSFNRKVLSTSRLSRKPENNCNVDIGKIPKFQSDVFGISKQQWYNLGKKFVQKNNQIVQADSSNKNILENVNNFDKGETDIVTNLRGSETTRSDENNSLNSSIISTLPQFERRQFQENSMDHTESEEEGHECRNSEYDPVWTGLNDDEKKLVDGSDYNENSFQKHECIGNLQILKNKTFSPNDSPVIRLNTLGDLRRDLEYNENLRTVSRHLEYCEKSGPERIVGLLKANKRLLSKSKSSI